MAEHDCISEVKISKAQRQYIVGYVPNQGDTSTPNINLKGKWLREAGFDRGVHVTVKITNGCIVIIKDSDEVDELKRKKDSLRLELLELKQTNQEIRDAAKAAFQKIPGLTG